MIGDMIEKECVGCGKKILVFKDYIREKMFCTLGCMDISKDNNPVDNS